MLCNVCESFDIQALYTLAAKLIENSKPEPPTRNRAFPLYRGFPRFFNHHPGLASLLAASEDGCNLCSYIWQQVSRSLPPEARTARVSDVLRDYETQIFLGLSDWSPEAEGFPYLDVTQELPRGATRKLATFDVFAERENVPHGYGHLLGRDVDADPSSERSLSMVSRWFDECLHSHSLCQSQSGRRKSLPTRVLDVGRAGSSGNPYLILTEGITGTWSALSYCWGGNSSFVLRTDNIDKFRSGFYQIEDYPKTFRDAIMITRSLHISFIWIDALCILQDYSEDWAVEAGRMQDVYAGAIITLCASNSTRSSEGMLGARQTPADICPIPWGTERSTGEVTVFLRSGSHFWDANMRGEPLNRRGWTLQESLLSPRELSYGKQQTAWECQQIRTSESGRPILPGERFRKKDMIQTLITGKRDYRQRITQSLTRLSLRIMPVKFSLVPLAWEQHHDAMYTRWFAVTQEFTSRSLTYPSDTFPALSGLAKVFQSFLNDQYCAGLWKNDMVRGLMWARPSARGTSTQTPRPALDYRIPSWSWASISGGPIYNAITNEEKWSTRYITELARVVSVVIKPRFSDPYGQISDGFLTLSAPFRPLSDQTFDKNNDQNTSLPALEQRIRQNSALPTAEFGQQHVPHTGQRFAVLRIAKFHEKFTSEITGRMALNRTAGLLILETTGQQENEYRRIGLLILNSSQLDDSYDPIETNLLSFDVMSEAKFVKKEVKIV